MILRYLVLLLPLLLMACSDGEDIAEAQSADVETLYNEAYDDLAQQSYKNAISAFEEVERQHPSSEWAVRSQIMAAYAAYRANDYPQAISILERFVRLHPSNVNTPYAYYLIGLSYYEQISDVGRDQKMTELALQALTDVVRRFPDTEYARDAKLKLDLTYDHLAGKEMQVGRYYLVRDEYLAAINRFRYVVENYETTSHVPEALHRLVEAYLSIGVEEEAQAYAAVLGANFPGSQWYRDSYALMRGEVQSATPQDNAWYDRLMP